MPASIPPDYEERVYAGVLGKIIGVYLGRPFEGWWHDRIIGELGEVWYYVHERRGLPLIVTDDDISGTFTFLRALPDYGNDPDIAPAQIGQTWLNYLIEKRTVLWWGGMGNSTEHTAYLRLKHGIQAPASGSIVTNGKVVAEQIGAQIFIDGWGMVCPGDPERAADLARRAASVSHDGEAIYAAQVVAAMEALAFVERRIPKLIDIAAGLIPADSVIARMIGDLKRWRAQEPNWRVAYKRLAATYGYDKYGGNCHVVPNHGLIILSLLYGDGDFQRTLMIVNTCGWDTDCNSGNVGCLMGIVCGLDGIDAGPDWRGPVADRVLLPTADGGRCITDAVQEACRIANIGRALASEQPVHHKGGARFHFQLPGAVQGFTPQSNPSTGANVALANVEGHSVAGTRALAIRYSHVAPGCPARVATPTFVLPQQAKMEGYGVVASPTIYPGQTLRAGLSADGANSGSVTCRIYLDVYDADDGLRREYGPEVAMKPGAFTGVAWTVPDTAGYPIAQAGVEIASDRPANGQVYLDYLTWDGPPNVFFRGTDGGTMWRRAWVNGADHFDGWGDAYTLIQDEGVGLAIQGTREWSDYRVSAGVNPHMAKSCGIAARAQGMRRYYALLLCNDAKVRLVKALDGLTTLAEADLTWQPDVICHLSLEASGPRIRASVDGQPVFDVTDGDRPLLDGAIALVCEEGRISVGDVRVQPVG